MFKSFKLFVQEQRLRLHSGKYEAYLNQVSQQGVEHDYSARLRIATDVLRDLNDPFIRSFGDATFTSTLAVLTVLAGIEGRRLRQRTVRLDDRAAVLAREEDDLVAASRCRGLLAHRRRGAPTTGRS